MEERIDKRNDSTSNKLESTNDVNESIKDLVKVIWNANVKIYHIINKRWWKVSKECHKFVVRSLLLIIVVSNTIWYFAYSGNKVIKRDIQSQMQLKVDSISRIVEMQESAMHYRETKDSLDRVNKLEFKSVPTPRKKTTKVIPVEVTKTIKDTLK